MYLSDEDKRTLDGEEGRLKQVALENVIRYAHVLGAPALCEVTKATVFCGAHSYLWTSADQMISMRFFPQ